MNEINHPELMEKTIADIKKEYFGKINHLDLDLILAHVLKKPREFVLAYPEHEIPKFKIKNLKLKISRRMRAEPLAYILGSREFFSLAFLISPATLIPRPETELMVEMALEEISSLAPKEMANIIDIGTGSGNIIISVAKNSNIKSKVIRRGGQKSKFFGIDISNEALKVAKKNAKVHGVAEKIKFIHGSLLDKIKNIDNSMILANLPYLSREIYNTTDKTVKKYEPRSALYSPKEGLQHYEELFKQIKKFNPQNCNVFLEISPEQKTKLPKMIKKYLPGAKIEFQKDLAGKWRVCKIIL